MFYIDHARAWLGSLVLHMTFVVVCAWPLVNAHIVEPARASYYDLVASRPAPVRKINFVELMQPAWQQPVPPLPDLREPNLGLPPVLPLVPPTLPVPPLVPPYGLLEPQDDQPKVIQAPEYIILDSTYKWDI